MKTPSSSFNAAPLGLERPRLSSGSVGDIPLTASNLAASFMWWLLWAAVCALAVMVSPAKAQAVAWASSAQASTQPASAGSQGAAPQASNLPAALTGIQAELVSMLKGRSEQIGPDSALPAGRARVEVVLGQLDPRLKLAPCDKVNAYMPDGARLWGRTRVGLRCEQGSVRWNVYWPVTVKVWGPAVVAVVPLKPGSLVSAADLRVAEVDLAESSSPAILKAEEVIGRSVLRSIEPGQGLRQDDIRMRRWFAAGDPVQVTVRGQGFAIASEGTALSPGDEGQCVRIRVEGGRVLCGRPVGDRRAEITL